MYALVSEAIIAFAVFGILTFINAQIVAPWLTIVLAVLMCIALLFVVAYLLILCSVAVTYKQSVGANLRDAWLLLWLNIAPNLIHVLFAILPVLLYLLTSGGMLQGLVMAFIMMFGGMYVPLVWQSHMMRTFALFHPVEAKKKGKKGNKQVATQGA